MIITNSILNGFLLKHRIKGRFLDNIRPRNYNFTTKGYEWKPDIIDRSFDWWLTPEDYEYWHRYHSLYREYHAKYSSTYR